MSSSADPGFPRTSPPWALRLAHGLAGPRAGGAAVSIAGSPFVAASGVVDVPPRVRGAAELALVSSAPRAVRDGGRPFVVTGVRRPFPALVAVPGAGASAADASGWAAACLATSVLPRLAEDDPLLPVVAASPGLAGVAAALARVASAPLPVLLLGETGTGKDVVARALHAASRRRGAFVAENCAALPETLLEAELFGSRRGAFTGADRDRRGRIAEADAGTLFLDEVGDLPRTLQAKLLRALQDHEIRPLGARRAVRVDLRVVSATHAGLPHKVRDGTFRGDLYFRLAGYVGTLPPLRERRADLPYLAAALLARLADDGLGPGRSLDEAGLRRLGALEFRGNVRELDNLLRRASALASSARIDPDLLEPDAAAPPRRRNLESTMILEALRMSHGVKAEAARRLGWSRQKLYRRIGALGLAPAERDRPRL